MNGATHLATSDEVKDREAAKEKLETIDFKMVTFSLAGKDYGIDIMKVKEIAKANRFTYVPNAPPFVRGVYNLRGEIISIIDLRVMFHLPAERKEEDALENLLILRLEDNILGVIVDVIDKVVGISKYDIQPPHPIFGDVNIQYISGVVENDKRLYIILDVERVFGREKDKREEKPILEQFSLSREQIQEAVTEKQEIEDINLNFIAETLATFSNFHASPVNMEWIEKRFVSWKASREAQNRQFQLTSPSEAEEFLAPFYSSYTNSFWGEEYCTQFMSLLPSIESKAINVWNIGCGKGYETYSLLGILKKKYPAYRIKVWANDNDLLSISTAPNLVFQDTDVPAFMQEWVVKGKNGFGFRTEFKDHILFEYHDIANTNPLPDVDFIVARDVISFLKPNEQLKLLSEFWEKLKWNGMLFLGQNERIGTVKGWKTVEAGNVIAFKKEKS